MKVWHKTRWESILWESNLFSLSKKWLMRPDSTTAPNHPQLWLLKKERERAPWWKSSALFKAFCMTRRPDGNFSHHTLQHNSPQHRPHPWCGGHSVAEHCVRAGDPPRHKCLTTTTRSITHTHISTSLSETLSQTQIWLWVIQQDVILSLKVQKENSPFPFHWQIVVRSLHPGKSAQL